MIRIMTTFTKRISPPFVALLGLLALTACAGTISSAEESLSPPAAETLTVEAAHGFTLPSGLEGDVSLDSYAGERNVVLVFYRGFW